MTMRKNIKKKKELNIPEKTKKTKRTISIEEKWNKVYKKIMDDTSDLKPTGETKIELLLTKDSLSVKCLASDGKSPCDHDLVNKFLIQNMIDVFVTLLDNTVPGKDIDEDLFSALKWTILIHWKEQIDGYLDEINSKLDA